MNKKLRRKAVRTYLVRPGLKVKRIEPATRKCVLIRINLVGDGRKVSDVTTARQLQRLWKADAHARSVYAEYQWKLLQDGASSDDGEIHWECMFQDRTVRRRYDKRLRDRYIFGKTCVCVGYGREIERIKYVRQPRCGYCRQVLAEEAVYSRFMAAQNRIVDDTHRLNARKRMYIGKRHKPTLLFTGHPNAERKLIASSILETSEQTPANVKEWAKKRHRARRTL